MPHRDARGVCAHACGPCARACGCACVCARMFACVQPAANPKSRYRRPTHRTTIRSHRSTHARTHARSLTRTLARTHRRLCTSPHMQARVRASGMHVHTGPVRACRCVYRHVYEQMRGRVYRHVYRLVYRLVYRHVYRPLCRHVYRYVYIHVYRYLYRPAVEPVDFGGNSVAGRYTSHVHPIAPTWRRDMPYQTMPRHATHHATHTMPCHPMPHTIMPCHSWLLQLSLWPLFFALGWRRCWPSSTS